MSIAFLVVCICSVRGNRDQEAPIHLEAALNGERCIEQIGGIDVHEHGATQHAIEFTIKWQTKVWKPSVLNLSGKRWVGLLGEVNQFWRGIYPKCLKALAV